MDLQKDLTEKVIDTVGMFKAITNKLYAFLLILCGMVTITIIVSSLTVCSIVKLNNETLSQIVDTYFTTDHGYPSMDQSVEIRKD